MTSAHRWIWVDPDDVCQTRFYRCIDRSDKIDFSKLFLARFRIIFSTHVSFIVYLCASRTVTYQSEHGSVDF
jgi:hypothetical protein